MKKILLKHIYGSQERTYMNMSMSNTTGMRGITTTANMPWTSTQLQPSPSQPTWPPQMMASASNVVEAVV